MLAVTLAGCKEEKYIKPIISPALQLEYLPMPQAGEITVRISPSQSVARFRYALGSEQDL
ncbi:MAG: hypothetical protein LUD68_04325 [Rikenellaceae bacterium]|nr:hypothetical protein [Rikenellaceae bacterium]